MAISDSLKANGGIRDIDNNTSLDSSNFDVIQSTDSYLPLTRM